LINDEAYAARMAEYLINSGISKREAEFKLINKGIAKDLAHSFFENIDDESGKIKQLLERKYANKLGDAESVKKVFAALIRKGFSYSDVKSALKEYSEEIMYSED
ncbi:MAG: RecX family transcriptional regulator, partial [Clostridia bacterium]|nr:RecX family transcriptional regulator [Clostridia bacterium]